MRSVFLFASFFIILLLFFAFVRLLSERQKSKIFITPIMKQDIIQDNQNSSLKYFYEPKPNATLISHPDWLGYDVRNTINADGFNERFNYTEEKRVTYFVL